MRLGASSAPTAARLVLAAGLVAASWLSFAAGPAQAHIGPSHRWLPVASDYRAVVLGTTPPQPEITAWALQGDQTLRLRVHPDVEVVVLGYIGEPFLRFARGEVDVNQHAATAYAAGLGRRDAPPALDPSARPSWRRVAVGEVYAWHDHRLRPPGLRRPHGAAVAAWTVPLRVGGVAARLAGRTSYANGGSVARWLLVGALLAMLGPVVAPARSPGLRRAGAAALAAGSLGALLVGAAGVWLDTPRSTGDTGVVMAAGAVLAALAVVAMALVEPAAAALVTLAVALLAISVGATFAPMLTHGFALSALPADAARLSVCIAVGLGLAAAIAAAADVVRALRRPQSPAGATGA
jgi:hypothetical protein